MSGVFGLIAIIVWFAMDKMCHYWLEMSPGATTIMLMIHILIMFIATFLAN